MLKQTLRTSLITLLPAGGLRRSVGTLVGGSALAQAINIATAPISTRLFTPGDYGTAGVYNAILSLLTIIACGRYEMAVPLPKTDKSALDVLLLSLLVTLGFAGLSGCAIWLGGDRLVQWTHTECLRHYVWLLPIAVVGGGAYQSLNYWAIRHKSYTCIARTQVNQSIFSVAVSLGTVALVPGPLGLLLGGVVGQTAGISTLAGDALQGVRRFVYRPGLADLRRAAWAYRQFPIYSSGASLLNSAGLVLPAVLLSSLYGAEVTGWFALAQRIVSLPLSVLGQAVSQVFLGEAAQDMRGEQRDLRRLFDRVTVRLLPTCAIVLIIGSCSPFMFGFLFGKKWTMAGMYAALLAISCSGQLLTSPVSTVAILTGRQDLQLALDAIRTVLVVGALWAPAALGASALFTVGTYAASMTILYVVYFTTYRRLANTAACAECG